MSIKAQLILPDNLRSTYLRGDFIDDGNLYFTGRINSDYTQDTNQSTLTFGFQLADVITRDAVALDSILQLEISNDPNFNPSSVITIVDWPAGGGYDPTLDYTVVLNTAWFFTPSGSPESSRSTAPGNGYFYVQNWPLSSNGGLATVYFRAVVKAITGDQATYPDNYGIFDQIFWQSENPSTPGVPQIAAPQQAWTGRKTIWRFDASEEPSTGLYGSGVSRYLGSILDIRTSHVLSNIGSRITVRTLAPELPANALALTSYAGVDNYSNPTLTTYAPGVAQPSGAVINGSAGVASTDAGFAYYGGSQLSFSSTSPDFGVQAQVVVIPKTGSSICRVYIKAFQTAAPLGGANEVGAVIQINANQTVTTKLYRTVAGSTVSEFVATLPPTAYAEIVNTNGGTFEIFLQNVTQPTADAQMLVEAFYTPYGASESLRLGSAIMKAFTGSLGASFAVYGDANYTINELMCVNGKFLLDGDLGDCQLDDVSQNTSFSTSVGTINDTEVSWVGLDSLGTFIAYSDAPNSGTYTGATFTSSYLQVYGNGVSDTFVDVAEVQPTAPSFSDRVRVNFWLSHLGGEFYVGFSPKSNHQDLSDDKPMALRCPPQGSDLGEEYWQPTLLIVFNRRDNIIYAAQRLADNTLVTKTIARYNGTDDNVFVAVEVDSTAPDITADGIWVKITLGDTPPIYYQFEQMLSSADFGCGYYVAVGARSCLSNTTPISLDAGLAKIGGFVMGGLPPRTAPNEDDLISQRHFGKSNAGSTYQKSWLGQKMLAGNTDFAGWGHSIPALSSGLSVKAASTGLNVTLGSTALTIDGVSIGNGDLFLLKDQDDFTQNGVYVATHSGSWSYASYETYEDDGTTPSNVELVIVTQGTINLDSLWYTTSRNPFDPDGATMYAAGDQTYLCTTVFQKVDIASIGSSFSSLHPQLLELKIRTRDNRIDVPLPKIRFYSDADGSPYLPISGAVLADQAPYPQTTTGAIAPFNDLVQFDLLNSGLTVTPGTQIWLAISLFSRADLGIANARESTDVGLIASGNFRGYSTANDVWFKLHAKSTRRHDNAYHQAVLQTRVWADSHARVPSQASTLSTVVSVDIRPPSDSGVFRPTVTTTLPPAVRTVSLEISASDTDSGMLAFRVGKEMRGGVVDFTNWQPWSMFLEGGSVQYVIYLYSDDATQDDGPRQVWVQVMDAVGNISESHPVVVLAQPVLLVDTVPPAGTASFVDLTSGSSIEASGSRTSLLALSSSDRVSETKDVRIRKLGAGTAGAWGTWMPYTEYIQWLIDSDLTDSDYTDGLKRLEVQFRDYGNNIQQAEPLWDSLFGTASFSSSDEPLPSGSLRHRGTMFVASTKWTSPTDAAEMLYLSALKHEEFANYSLVDAGDPNYAPQIAFAVISNVTGSIGRKVAVRSTDTTDIGVSYTIDEVRGLIVFGATNNSIDTVTVKRTSAQIYKWDGNAVVKVADLGSLDEQIVLSMCGTSDSLLLGGGSGKLWGYDGRTVSGPIFIAQSGSSLPISVLTTHQFQHESTPYVYLGTATKPCLFRAIYGSVGNEAAWERVSELGFLNTSSGSVTCACSAYNMLFLGTDSGVVLSYERYLEFTTDTDDTEVLNQSALKNQHLGTSEDDVLPVNCSLWKSGYCRY